MSWKKILKSFSFDPNLPRGISRKEQGGIEIGLPAWKKVIEQYERPTHEMYMPNRPKHLGEEDLEGSEKLVQEISRTIGHEWTHQATQDEFMKAKEEALEEMRAIYRRGGDFTQIFEKFATILFLQEYVARVGHEERQSPMQLEIFLNRGALTNYAEKAIKRLSKYMYHHRTGKDPHPATTPEEIESVPGLREFIGVAENVIPRKFMQLATEYREKLGV